MNVTPLRKGILKETVIFALLGVLIGGCVWYLDSIHTGFVSRKSNATGKSTQLITERQNMETRFLNVKEQMPIYDMSRRWIASPGLYIDSQAVRDLFNYYQASLFLKRISVEMQPITNMTDARFVLPNFVGTHTISKVIVDALSDEDIYALIETMQKELPGFLKITNLTLSKNKDLSKEILSEVRSSGSVPLVHGEISFDWYGMKATDATNLMNKYVPPKRGDQSQ